MMKHTALRKYSFLYAASAASGLITSAYADAGSFLTLTNLTSNDVHVIAEADANAGANGVTFVDLDGAGSEDSGVYKVTADTTLHSDP